MLLVDSVSAFTRSKFVLLVKAKKYVFFLSKMYGCVSRENKFVPPQEENMWFSWKHNFFHAQKKSIFSLSKPREKQKGKKILRENHLTPKNTYRKIKNNIPRKRPAHDTWWRLENQNAQNHHFCVTTHEKPQLYNNVILCTEPKNWHWKSTLNQILSAFWRGRSRASGQWAMY